MQLEDEPSQMTDTRRSPTQQLNDDDDARHFREVSEIDISSSTQLYPEYDFHDHMTFKECNYALTGENTTVPSDFVTIMKRKPKLIVDEVMIISNEDMMIQMKNTNDTIAPVDLAPPNKRYMLWKEAGNRKKTYVRLLLFCKYNFFI